MLGEAKDDEVGKPDNLPDIPSKSLYFTWKSAVGTEY